MRHDLIDAVFALGHEDDLVRLVARVEALQAFLKTDDGANLLAGYKRAANILKVEEKKDGKTYHQRGQRDAAWPSRRRKICSRRWPRPGIAPLKMRLAGAMSK